MVLTPAIVAKILVLAAAAILITGPLYQHLWHVVFIQLIVFGAAWLHHKRMTRFVDEVNKKLDRIDRR